MDPEIISTQGINTSEINISPWFVYIANNVIEYSMDIKSELSN